MIKTFTKYVDMVQKLYRRGRPPGWSEEYFRQLSLYTEAFMLQARDTFSKYQLSEWRTSKFHALTHIVEDISHTGGVEYMHGGFYESAHKLFMKYYSMTSKCMSSAM